MIPVIMSGGSGTRLWPISRSSHPKQFCEFFKKSFMRETIERLNSLGPINILTVKSMETLTNKAALPFGITTENIILEPFGRNTAPAIALLCWKFLQKKQDAEVVGIFPADHMIQNQERFIEAIQLAEKCAQDGYIVTLGIKPNKPATGYGYIEIEPKQEVHTSENLSAFNVKRFCEKPNLATANEFLSAGNFMWNAGMFVFRVNAMCEFFKEFQPNIWSKISELNEDLSNLESVYKAIDPISIDHGIMEKVKKQICVPCDIEWSDVGSWEELSRLSQSSQKTDSNNKAKVHEFESDKNFVFSSKDKNFCLVNVEDLIVVDTPDATLISKKEKSENIKKLLDSIQNDNDSIADEHLFEERPWGKYEILAEANDFKSKVITVTEGAQLSYQSHEKRIEHWVVVKGTAEVILNDTPHILKASESIEIPLKAKHRIKNIGSGDLIFIEVQTGEYFGEDDIIRYQDNYGRA